MQKHGSNCSGTETSKVKPELLARDWNISDIRPTEKEKKINQVIILAKYWFNPERPVPT